MGKVRAEDSSPVQTLGGVIRSCARPRRRRFRKARVTQKNNPMLALGLHFVIVFDHTQHRHRVTAATHQCPIAINAPIKVKICGRDGEISSRSEGRD